MLHRLDTHYFETHSNNLIALSIVVQPQILLGSPLGLNRNLLKWPISLVITIVKSNVTFTIGHNQQGLFSQRGVVKPAIQLKQT